MDIQLAVAGVRVCHNGGGRKHKPISAFLARKAPCDEFEHLVIPLAERLDQDGIVAHRFSRNSFLRLGVQESRQFP